MADHTAIEWTDATWNPITGCSIVSPGCTNCYAMKLAGTRLKHIESRKSLTKDSKAGPVWTGEVRFNKQWLDQPLRWKQPRRIFVCAHGDLFAENVPDEWIDQVFAVMALSPQHTFQVLTKRAQRMRAYLAEGRDRRAARRCVDLATKDKAMMARMIRDIDDKWPVVAEGDPEWPDDLLMRHWPLPNVWLGVSAEDQKRADERIPELLATPAAVRFVSAEPLLGPIEMLLYLSAMQIGVDWSKEAGGGSSIFVRPPLDWVIVGGESGSGARPMHPGWARSIRDQCAAANVPFFFKQWGGHRPLTDAEHGQACGATLIGSDPYDREAYVLRVGKKAAGRLLDGVEHSAMPETQP